MGASVCLSARLSFCRTCSSSASCIIPSESPRLSMTTTSCITSSSSAAFLRSQIPPPSARVARDRAIASPSPPPPRSTRRCGQPFADLPAGGNLARGLGALAVDAWRRHKSLAMGEVRTAGAAVGS
jgi:hypothetical protein